MEKLTNDFDAPVGRAAYTAVVIDMQPWELFPDANNEDTIKACEEFLRLAMRDEADIVFVETPYYDNDEPAAPHTHKRLTDLVGSYPCAKRAVVEKLMKYGYGSDNVLNCCLQKGFQTQHFRVCGIRTGSWVRKDGGFDIYDGKKCPTGCVFSLVHELSERLLAGKTCKCGAFPGMSVPASQCKCGAFNAASSITVVQDACYDSFTPVHWEDFSEHANVKLARLSDFQS